MFRKYKNKNYPLPGITWTADQQTEARLQMQQRSDIGDGRRRTADGKIYPPEISLTRSNVSFATLAPPTAATARVQPPARGIPTKTTAQGISKKARIATLGTTAPARPVPAQPVRAPPVPPQPTRAPLAPRATAQTDAEVRRRRTAFFENMVKAASGDKVVAKSQVWNNMCVT